MGPELVSALIKVPDQALKSSWGYLPNDLVIGKILDNNQNRQQGEIQATREYVKLLFGNLHTPAADQAFKALVANPLEKWWFPSAEKTLAEGLKSLDAVANEIKRGGLKAPGDPETLAKVLGLADSQLAAEEDLLTSPNLGAFATDDRFCHAQGVARVADEAIKGALASFAEAVDRRGARPDLEAALQSLDHAARLDPFIIIGGSPDGMTANHLLILAYDLTRARVALDRAREKLAAGIELP